MGCRSASLGNGLFQSFPPIARFHRDCVPLKLAIKAMQLSLCKSQHRLLKAWQQVSLSAALRPPRCKKNPQNSPRTLKKESPRLNKGAGREGGLRGEEDACKLDLQPQDQSPFHRRGLWIYTCFLKIWAMVPECHGPDIHVSPTFLGWNPKPQKDGDWVFERYLGQAGRILSNEMSALIWETPARSFALVPGSKGEERVP